MDKTILNQLDGVKKVTEIAAIFACNRSAVYQSLRGDGSRRIRVFVAGLLETKPSELWTENNEDSLKLDDALFFHSVGVNRD